MRYVEVWEIIYNAIKDNNLLAGCFNYDPKTIEQFPTAIVLPADLNSVILDTTSNNNLIWYKIRISDQNTNLEVTEARVRAVCDSILENLDTIPQIISKNIVWGWTDDEQPMRVCEINVVYRCVI